MTGLGRDQAICGHLWAFPTDSLGRDSGILAPMYGTLCGLRYGLVLGWAALASLAAGSSLADERLWAALKEGGKVVLMRHAHVDMEQGNLGRHGRGNCEVEVNLSRRGQEQAKRLGDTFRARGIPVGDVLASPYCRAMDTGKLAFGRATAADFLMPPGVLPEQQAAVNVERASRVIAQHSGPLNLVMITHGPNITEISLLGFVEMGEFVVLKAKAGIDFDVIGTILLKAE